MLPTRRELPCNVLLQRRVIVCGGGVREDLQRKNKRATRDYGVGNVLNPCEKRMQSPQLLRPHCLSVGEPLHNMKKSLVPLIAAGYCIKNLLKFLRMNF